MRLPQLFSKKTITADCYLGLFLKETEAIGFIYEVHAGRITTIAKERIAYTDGWEHLAEDIDQMLMRLENETHKHIESVIFFLYSHFINEITKEIKQPYKSAIKKLSKDLELKPLGYIECYEAVLRYLEKKEHTLLNGILVELDKTNMGVFIYQGGRQVFHMNGSRTDNFIQDLTDILGKAQAVTLPSKIILYDSSEAAHQSSALVTHQWDAQQFVQYPRIEVVKEEDVFTGLQTIFIDQLNQTAAPVKQEMPPSSDIPDMYEPPTPASEVSDNLPAEVMGFKIGQDVGNEPPPEETIVEPGESAPKKSSKKMPNILGPILLPFQKIMVMAKSGKKNSLIFLGVIVFFILFGLMGTTEYLFHKASVTVFFPALAIEKDVPLTLDPDQNDIDLKMATTSASVTDQKATTGKRQTGDKAKGGVTIENFDVSGGKTFDKGTVLTAQGKSFTLDDTVQVASASDTIIDNGSVRQPGKATGSVTANDIGPDYNLDKNNKFQIADLSTSLYYAINDSAFSGGTKKDISTVAKADTDALKKSVLAKGEDQTKQTLQKQEGDTQILDALTTSATSQLQYSKEVGEEATSVSLTTNVVTTYYAYSSNALKKKLRDMLQQDVTQGFAIPVEKVQYTIKSVKATNSGIALTLHVQTSALKEVSKDDVVQAIKGKSVDNLDSIVKDTFKASDVTVTSDSDPVFFLKNRLPFSSKNIDLKIDSR